MEFLTLPGEPIYAWIRTTLARNLAAVERRIGTRLRRVETEGGLAPVQALDVPLGCGGYGCVFALEDGRALKVTADESEGPLTLYVKSLQESGARTQEGPVLAATARFDDVFRFPRRVRAGGVLTPVYGIVREQLGRVGEGASTSVEDAVDLYTEGWDAFCEAQEEGGGFIGVAVARVALRRLRAAGRPGRRLAALLEYAWDDGVPLMDVHSGNLAVRQANGRGGARRGQLVVFDLGATEACAWPRRGELPAELPPDLDYEDRLEALASQIDCLSPG